MKLAFFRSCGAMLALAALGVTTGVGADTATVSTEALNVRGRAGFIGEVITRLNRGDTVTILDTATISNPEAGEPAQWFKIALPANTPVWVHGYYVSPETHTITASELKVRGGPGVNYSVLGMIEEGTAVTEIRRQGEWIEIEPPGGLSAYIAASLVTRDTASASQPATAQTPTPTQANRPSAAPTVGGETTVPDMASQTTASQGTSSDVAAETPVAPTTDSMPVEVVESTEVSDFPVGADIGTPRPPAPASRAGSTSVGPASSTIVAEPRMWPASRYSTSTPSTGENR